MTVTVVGPNGFLGRRVVATLAGRGHRVHVFGRANPPVLDGVLDPRVAASDHVVWAASSVNPLIAENDPDLVALDISTFTAFLAAVAAAGRGGPRTVLLSSGGTVYDPAERPPYSETSRVAPRTAYGRTKLQLERILLATDPAGLVLRVSNAYGPEQAVAPGQGVLAHWLHAIAAGQDIHLFGDGSVARDYVHVDDVAHAVAAAVEHDYRAHPVLNIGAGRPTTLAELFEVTAHAVGQPSLRPRTHEARSFDVASTWLDCRLAERTLGWAARTPLVEGVAAMWHSLVTAPPPTVRAVVPTPRTTYPVGRLTERTP